MSLREIDFNDLPIFDIWIHLITTEKELFQIFFILLRSQSLFFLQNNINQCLFVAFVNSIIEVAIYWHVYT